MKTASHSVLIVDDEPQIQRFLRHALEAAGYELRFADRGATALHMLAHEKPDLLVLDLGLPDMDGKAVLGQLRQTSDLPVIVLSARDNEAEKIAALDLGPMIMWKNPSALANCWRGCGCCCARVERIRRIMVCCHWAASSSILRHIA